MKKVIEAWGQADLRPAHEAFDENIVWKSAASHEDGKLCFGGVYNGKAAVIMLLSKLSTRYYFRRYVAKEIISKGEVVWGLFDVQGSYISTNGATTVGKPISIENAFRWRIRNGKVVEAQSFFDTVALLAQQGELRM